MDSNLFTLLIYILGVAVKMGSVEGEHPPLEDII